MFFVFLEFEDYGQIATIVLSEPFDKYNKGIQCFMYLKCLNILRSSTQLGYDILRQNLIIENYENHDFHCRKYYLQSKQRLLNAIFNFQYS